MKKVIKKAQSGVRVDKTSTGPRRDANKDIQAERSTVKAKNKAEVDAHKKRAKEFRESAGTSLTMKAMNIGKPDPEFKGVRLLNRAAAREDSLASSAAKHPKYKPALKNGGKIIKKKK